MYFHPPYIQPSRARWGGTQHTPRHPGSTQCTKWGGGREGGLTVACTGGDSTGADTNLDCSHQHTHWHDTWLCGLFEHTGMTLGCVVCLSTLTGMTLGCVVCLSTLTGMTLGCVVCWSTLTGMTLGWVVCLLVRSPTGFSCHKYKHSVMKLGMMWLLTRTYCHTGHLCGI